MRLRGIVTIPPFRLTGWAWTSLVRVIATRRLARSVEKENSSCMLTVLLYSILRIYLCFEGGVKIVKAPGLYARERKVEKSLERKVRGRKREEGEGVSHLSKVWGIYVCSQYKNKRIVIRRVASWL